MVDTHPWIIILGSLLGGMLLLSAGRRVSKAHRLTGAPSLRAMARGLYALAASEFFAALLVAANLRATLAIERTGFDRFDVLFWGYYGCLLVGLGLVFLSFGRHPFRWAPAVAGVLLVAGPALQFLVVVLLFFVVLHSGLNHIARKGAGSILVSVGFFFLLLGHIGNLTDYAPLEPRLWWAEIPILVGTILLWFAITKPRTVENA
jgi:hypothetical protein